MAVFNKFNAFVEHVSEKVHNLGADTLKIALSNTAPSASNTTLSDITQIAGGNGYTTGGTQATISASAQSGGLYKLVLADVVFTAAGGTIGPFQYFVLYNDSATSPADALIAWWDRGQAVTLSDGESFTWDASPDNGIMTLQ